jgi:hypothetical protein
MSSKVENIFNEVVTLSCDESSFASSTAKSFLKQLSLSGYEHFEAYLNAVKDAADRKTKMKHFSADLMLCLTTNNGRDLSLTEPEVFLILQKNLGAGVSSDLIFRTGLSTPQAVIENYAASGDRAVKYKSLGKMTLRCINGAYDAYYTKKINISYMKNFKDLYVWENTQDIDSNDTWISNIFVFVGNDVVPSRLRCTSQGKATLVQNTYTDNFADIEI